MPNPAILAGELVADDEADRHALGEADIAREERPAVVGLPISDAASEIASAELEGRDILEEEIARLRREQGEARRVDLPDIQRRIREIRIDGQRAGERRRDLVVGVAAGGEAYSGVRRQEGASHAWRAAPHRPERRARCRD